MQRRFWWKETHDSNSSFNFSWQSTSKGISFDKLNNSKTSKQIVNHFEFHKEITTKASLVKNLQIYCEVSNAYYIYYKYLLPSKASICQKKVMILLFNVVNFKLNQNGNMTLRGTLSPSEVPREGKGHISTLTRTAINLMNSSILK